MLCLQTLVLPQFPWHKTSKVTEVYGLGHCTPVRQVYQTLLVTPMVVQPQSLRQQEPMFELSTLQEDSGGKH